MIYTCDIKIIDKQKQILIIPVPIPTFLPIPISQPIPKTTDTSSIPPIYRYSSNTIIQTEAKDPKIGASIVSMK